MISMWIGFYLAHQLGTNMNDWYSLPLFVTIIACAGLECILYVFLALRKHMP